MTEPTVFLCAGGGAEYVLAPLAAHLRTAGRDVVELDMLAEAEPMAVVAPLIGRPVVLISSAHPAFNRHGLQVGYGKSHPMLSTLELMRLLTPKASFYVPHDLGQQIHTAEIAHMRQFTAVLAATDALWWLNAITNVVVVGWARATPRAARDILPRGRNDKPAAVLFLSELWHLERLGGAGVFERFAPLFDLGVPAKLPVWPGVEALEADLVARGATMIPAKVSSSDLIQEANLVLANAVSSTLTEGALAGRHSICLLDAIHPPEKQRQAFFGLPGIEFLDIAAAAARVEHLRDGAATLGPPPPVSARPFDFALAARTITAAA